MPDSTHPGAILRALMADAGALAPFVWDAGLARFAEDAGHHAVYMTGFGTAFTYGLPDIGLLGLDEMAANAERIAGAVDVPVIADADTGYGNPVNVTHTVERYERAGVAALPPVLAQLAGIGGGHATPDHRPGQAGVRPERIGVPARVGRSGDGGDGDHRHAVRRCAS